MNLDARLALQSYDFARKISSQDAVGEESRAGLSFSDALTEAARMMQQSLRSGETASTEAVRGAGDVQTLVEALSAAEMALETAVTVRDRVVEAYQEILRMPV